MSDGRAARAGAGTRVGAGAGRVVRAFRSLPHERRLAVYAAVGLFLSLFLPWYQRQFFVVIGGKIQPASDSQTAWGAFSLVEAAILLVSAGVLVLLFQRAEGKAFHLPGGDGGVITAAGFWSAVLIIWRIFDKQGGAAQGQNATSYGIEWGIFVALTISIGLILAGSRIRAAHQPEPPLPGDEDPQPAPSGPLAPRPGELPVLEARVVPPAPDEAATVAGRPSRSTPRPVPAERNRKIDAGPVEFVPAEPAEFVPRRRTATSPPASSSSGERPRGWLTARPRHLEETPPPPVAAEDPDATLPTRRRKLPPGDDQLTIPLDHEN